MIEVPSNNLSKEAMYPNYVDWRVYKYATGSAIPTGSIYLETIKNGDMNPANVGDGFNFVWHYFLVPVKKEL